ncbi:MAG: tetratricopeptide repeat protein [Nitrospirae bacterium]|nr:tetratricopeptide repeat protein [Nitrospirota bacterium]
MKGLFVSLLSACLVLNSVNPSSVYGLKIEDEKLKKIISNIMVGNENSLTQSGQAEALKEYESFLSQFDISNNQQAESLLRLGHLIMAMEENEEELQKIPVVPLRHHRDHTYSIGIYEKLRANAALYPTNDELLYQLAHGYDESDKKERSLSLLKELADRFPKSSYYAEARFRIGESYFNEGKFPEASVSYLKGLESNPANPLMDFISYKLIWSYFKMGDYRRTVDRVISSLNRYSVHQPNGKTLLDIESLSDSSWNEVKELIHLATLSIDFWGGTDKARSYFDFHGHVSFENLIYRPLGHLYLNRGKFQEAAYAFNTFLSLYPTHEDAPLFQLDLIEAYQKGEKPELAKQARESLIENFKPETAWWKANNQTAREKTALVRKEILFQQAQSYHGEAQKSNKRGDYLNAITSYQKFLSNFPKEMEAPRIHFFLGEAFFETDQFEQAASAYETSAYQYPLHLYSQDAGWTALISYEKALIRSPDSSKSLQQSLLKSCESYLKNFPHSPKRQTVLFKAMTLSLQTGNSKNGRAYAQQILDSPLDIVSAEMIVQTHFLLAKNAYENGEFDRAEAEFKETESWRRRPGYHDPDGPPQKEIMEFLASIQYKRADLLKNELKWKEAANAFYHLYEEYPESELAAVSLMNSGSTFLESKDYDSALNSFNKVTVSYPKSSFYQDAALALATLYERKGKWNEAASGYELLLSKTSESDKKNRYSDKLYSLYYRDGNWLKLNQILKSAFKESSLKNLKYLYFYGKSAKELNMDADVLLSADQALILLNQNELKEPEDEKWVMKAMLLKGDILAREFVTLILSDPIEKSLPLKKEKLKETLDTFNIAAQSGYPDIAPEALYHIGSLFEQFANDLVRSERPKELTPEQREIYEGLLTNQIKPFYQKAIDVYKQSLLLDKQLENEWVKKSDARYRQLILENKGS